MRQLLKNCSFLKLFADSKLSRSHLLDTLIQKTNEVSGGGMLGKSLFEGSLYLLCIAMMHECQYVTVVNRGAAIAKLDSLGEIHGCIPVQAGLHL